MFSGELKIPEYHGRTPQEPGKGETVSPSVKAHACYACWRGTLHRGFEIRPSPLFSLRFFGFFGESIVNARGANLSRICGHSYVLMYIDSLVNTRLRAFIHALSRALGRAGG